MIMGGIGGLSHVKLIHWEQKIKTVLYFRLKVKHYKMLIEQLLYNPRNF